ncbi:hypothetical protein FOYG_17335 [Fusarium oxysporum NRRL 32931]|uniref:Uncharacterized protein n=1 Tax=Fusarium oxysporum NRRL 32931 TaxID=660029 RepID=W9HEV3_FUSOX|nr:hypothetical protein FOYG_17335 [Fusarium oxysporum NRRL 32931]
MFFYTTISQPLVIFVFVSLLHPAHAGTHFSDQSGSCQIIGDPDIYGMGIRMGFYLQWASMQLGWLFNLRSQIHSMVDAWNIILVTIYINTYISHRQGSLMAIEWWVVLYETSLLIIAQLYYAMTWWFSIYNTVLIDGPTSTSVPLERSRLVSNALFCLVSGSFMVSQPWLAFNGLWEGLKEGCELRSFFYFKDMDMFDPVLVRTLRAISVISSVSVAPGVVIALVLLIIGSLYSLGMISQSPRAYIYPSLAKLYNITSAKDESERITVREVQWALHGGMRKAVRDLLEQEELHRLLDRLDGGGTTTNGAHDPVSTEQPLSEWLEPYRIIYQFLGSKYLWWLMSLLTAAIIIANIEMTLSLNHVDLSGAPLNSSGQLIALMSGILSIVSISWECLKTAVNKYRKRRKLKTFMAEFDRRGRQITRVHSLPDMFSVVDGNKEMEMRFVDSTTARYFRRELKTEVDGAKGLAWEETLRRKQATLTDLPNYPLYSNYSDTFLV